LSLSGINITFAKSEFDDIPPQLKNSDELILLLLENAAGTRNFIGNYSEDDLNKGARQLLKAGYLRGTIQDCCRCTWSSPTRKGSYLMRLLQQNRNLFEEGC